MMLQGIRVVEFEGLGPAPFAGMMLADLGAEVTVIHRPGPKTPTGGGPSVLDRGKRSIMLDLKDPADLEVAKALIFQSDALIEGYRPGVMERLGLGPEICHAQNARLVYGRMTGWGQDGPRAQTAGHDLNYIGLSGALWYAGAPGTAPVSPPTLVGDIGGGALYLVAGLLAGLLNAARSGQGTVVDAAIVDGSAHMMALLMSMAPFGHLSEVRGKSLLDGPHWCRSYQCADGGWLSVQSLEPAFYAEFLERMHLTHDQLFDDQNNPQKWPEQTARLADLFKQQPLAHWQKLFEGSDACVAPVLSPGQSAQDDHIQARQIWQRCGDVLQPAPAPRFDGVAPGVAEVNERGSDEVAIRAELREAGLLSG